MTLALAVALIWGGVWASTPGDTVGATVEIAAGESAAAVAAQLKEAGVVRSTFLFRRVLARTGADTRLHPGVYDLSGARSYADIAGILSGTVPRASEVTVTILEGWDLTQIADALAAQGLPGATELFKVTGVPGVDYRQLPQNAGADLSKRFPFLADKPAHVSLEGYLFPDTYRFYPDATVGDVLDAMLGNFDRKLTPELRAKVAASGRSLFEVVTMASIVEREVRGHEDQRKVADLFWRRYDIGMALQADSTVNYVTRKGLPAVSYEDTQLDSRYNTYKYPGLPLGPIGNPGLSALAATVDPLPNDAWYFLTDEDGTVHYGRTLDEHNANKNRYLR